jgi:hypothetical protein
MSRASNILSTNTEFEAFLFAPVGEQKNGMTVSIFSALARLDIDPWREARRLSDLPRDRAIRALCASLDRLTDPQWTKIDAEGIAAGLVGMLPNHDGLVRLRAGADDAVVSSRKSATSALPPGKAAQHSKWVWLVVGAAAIIAFYVLTPADKPSNEWSPSSYDNPVREQPRR